MLKFWITAKPIRESSVGDQYRIPRRTYPSVQAAQKDSKMIIWDF